jgi:Putative transposase/Transposase zinc-binding domain
LGPHAAVCGRESAPRPRLEIADVFRAFGQSFRAHHTLNPDQARVFDAVLACRTAVLGGHLDVCETCGFERPSYNSCFNRHCPKCQGIAALRWVEARKKAILPVAYFHVVFTLPAELRPLALRNREAIFDLLFETASQTLLTLGRDPDRLGGLLGLTAVLHTWTRDLSFHPHLHCIVTGGGLSADGWRTAGNGRYLFPIAAMSKLFRGKFLAGLRRLYRTAQLDLRGSCTELADPDVFASLVDKLYRIQWRPYAKRPFAGPEQVFDYLGYYTHRVGISGHRLLAIDADSVRFKTRDTKVATLKGEEFVRRFLLHVLPRGFVKIRHYGLLAAKAQHKRELVRDVLPAEAVDAARAQAQGAVDRPLSEPTPVTSLALIELARLCPSCGQSPLVPRALHERPPPGDLARLA